MTSSNTVTSEKASTIPAIDNGRVTKMYMNSSEPGMQNISMNIYIIDRELLISQINTAMCADRYTLSAISWRPS
mgnify:CR=1 FL=1